MAQLVPVDPFDLIIFGGTGDLAMRKLLPALYHRDRDGQLTADSRIIAASRGALSQEEYLASVRRRYTLTSRKATLTTRIGTVSANACTTRKPMPSRTATGAIWSIFLPAVKIVSASPTSRRRRVCSGRWQAG